eukprot:8384987-Pyramimonas_sp.AAC.1
MNPYHPSQARFDALHLLCQITIRAHSRISGNRWDTIRPRASSRANAGILQNFRARRNFKTECPGHV